MGISLTRKSNFEEICVCFELGAKYCQREILGIGGSEFLSGLLAETVAKN